MGLIRKKVASLLVCLLLLSVFSGFSQAAYSTWVSDDYRIAKWITNGNLGPKFMHFTGNGITASTHRSNVSHALSQWAGSVPANATEDEQIYDISVFASTWSNVKQVFPQIPSDHTGITPLTISGNYTSDTFNGSVKRIHTVQGASVYVCTTLADGTARNATSIKRTTIHEMSHALGWIGHAPSSLDVLYAQATSTATNLRSAEKTHLAQIH